MVRLAFLWGYCEATWFFVIPDVGLTFIALHLGLRRSWQPLLAALLGSVLGASTIFLLRGYDWPRLWGHLPGFLPGMLPVAAHQLHTQGAAAILNGPEAGIPYRVYVWLASQQNVSLANVLVWTPLARLPRMLTPMLVALAFQRLVRNRRLNYGLWAALWTLIYAVYWGVFLSRYRYGC